MKNRSVPQLLVFALLILFGVFLLSGFTPALEGPAPAWGEVSGVRATIALAEPGRSLPAQLEQIAEPSGFEELLVQWGSLAGVAALIGVVINVFKSLGIVKDGSAKTWSAALNMIGLAVLLLLRVYQPELDIGVWDQHAGQIANVLLVVFGYILQLLSSKVTHIAVTGVPVIGKSFSQLFDEHDVKSHG